MNETPNRIYINGIYFSPDHKHEVTGISIIPRASGKPLLEFLGTLRNKGVLLEEIMADGGLVIKGNGTAKFVGDVVTTINGEYLQIGSKKGAWVRSDGLNYIGPVSQEYFQLALNPKQMQILASALENIGLNNIEGFDNSESSIRIILESFVRKYQS